MNDSRWGFWVVVTCASLVTTSMLWWLMAKPIVTDISLETKAQLRRGKEVYKKAGCWYCHHSSLKGMRTGDLSAHFANESGWVAYFYNPKKIRPQSSKSAYRSFLQRRKNGRYVLNEDGKALLAYLKQARQSSDLRGARRLLPMPTQARAEQGLQLYQSLCSSCHGSRGFGDGPMAKILPTSPRDLTQPKKWLCRSDSSANLRDIHRTIHDQTGGCGMSDLRSSLTQQQRDALADAVRRIAGMNRALPSHPSLDWKLPRRPVYRDLRKRDFRDWVKKMWERGYDRWLARWRKEQGANAVVLFRHWSNWRDWVEWQSFGLWVQSRASTLRIAKGDWRTAMQQKPRLRHVFQEWLKQKRKKPWIQFLKKVMRRDLQKDLERKYLGFLKSRKMSWPAWNFQTVVNPMRWWEKWKGWRHKANWMKYEKRRQWTHWLRRYDFMEYKDWRKRKERDLFRTWLDKQKVELFWAWRGRKVFNGMGCTSCHGKTGAGEMIYVNAPATDRKLKPGKPVPRKVKDLRKGGLQCGSSRQDVLRSIVVGVGVHMKGLSTRELLHYLKSRKRIREPWKSNTRRAKKVQADLWALASYVRFLSHQIPLMRTMRD